MATLILKATERCNSNCYYCDVVAKKDTGRSMGLDLLEAVFFRVDEYLGLNSEEKVEIIWHGGEPLLMGADYFREARAIQGRLCRDTEGRIFHSMQTNLLALDEARVHTLRALGMGAVGTSFDPEPHMRGPGKGRRDSDSYNRRFMAALDLLDRHQMAWGIIYVVTRRSLERPMDLFYFLTNLVPRGSINMNPVLIYDEARRDVAISPEEYVDFLGAIFPTWWGQRHRFPQVNPFRSLVETIIEGKTSLGCVESGSCTYVHVNVAPDGETSQCGRSADWGLLPYGNIRDRSLQEILADGQRDELDRRVRHLRENDCRGCRFWDICHGGCPLDAWSAHRSFMHKSEWCEARRGFITRHFEPVTGVRYAPRSSGQGAS